MSPQAPWQKSWIAFTQQLQSLISNEADSDSVAALFAGKSVTWQGCISHIAFDNLSSNVHIDLPAVTIDLPDHSLVSLNGVSVSVDDESKPLWSQYDVGDTVTFSACFISSPNPFPCVDITRFASGRVAIMLGLRRAVPNG